MITPGQQDPVLQESWSLKCLSFRGDFKRFYHGFGGHHESQVKSRPVAESGVGGNTHNDSAKGSYLTQSPLNPPL